MNVLMISFNPTGTGTYWRAYRFGCELAGRGHAVTLMATSPKSRTRVNKYTTNGLQLVETPDLLPGGLRSGWDVWNILSRINWLRGRTFELVHAFETRPVVIFPAQAASRREDVPLILDWADWFGAGGSVEERPNPLVRAGLRPLETFFENRYRSRADGTTAINSFLQRRAIELGADPATVRVIRNGSDVTVLPRPVSEARRALGLPTGAPMIGFVGRTYTRDARLMAEAFNQVLEEIPQARLMLVGYFNRPIEQWVSNPEAVLRSGPVSENDLYTHLAACQMCWLPLVDSGANRGRWPLKLNNYMTVARPVVATGIGDLREIVPAHRLGVVTPVEAARIAAETVNLLNAPERAAELGRSARQAAETVFSWENLTDQLESFYQQVKRGNHPV